MKLKKISRTVWTGRNSIPNVLLPTVEGAATLDPCDFPPVAWNLFFRDEDQIVYLRLVIHHGQLNSVFSLKIEGARSCRWKMMHFFTSWSPQITQNYLLKAANACLTSTCNSDSCVLLTLNSTISLSRGVLSAQFWLPVSDWLFTDRLYWIGTDENGGGSLPSQVAPSAVIEIELNHIGVFLLLLRIPRKPVFQGSESLFPADWKWGADASPQLLSQAAKQYFSARIPRSSRIQPEMLQQWTEVVFSTSNQSGHLPSDRCLTVSHQIIHGRWSRPKQHCFDRLFSPASPALANMLKGLRRGSAPGQAAFVTGASFLENQGNKTKGRQLISSFRGFSNVEMDRSSRLQKTHSLPDSRCTVTVVKRISSLHVLRSNSRSNLFDSSGSGDSRLSWLALTNGSKMLQNVLDYLPNNRVPHRPVVDEIYSSPSGPPPGSLQSRSSSHLHHWSRKTGFYVDELRDVSKILVSVDCRLELIQKEFKQQIPAIELWQEQTGGFLALLETPTVLPTHVSPLTPRSHLSPPRELRW
ncbi:hypothetical protein T4D_11615 [Trichinella pseudospiralis]|uniref:Uncharacterized protein n=1 Tax=Trichinella pseudospiralis TaxID=6337 RepID=A0A0V1G455_TRIPS|nr:hypothetical protein T4D_11615 [Trichinella pseudospiralis]